MSEITTEVKDFINDLKQEGICRVTDINKGYLFWSPYSQTKQPTCFIENAFNSECPSLKFEDYSSYITKSLPLITGTYFKPSHDKFVALGKYETRLNVYRPYIPVSDKSECPLFLELLERLLPDTEERHYFTQWLAHLIQCPTERPSVAVILTSQEGTGKGILFHKIISPLVSFQSRQCASYDEFLGKHATALSNTSFVMLDDVKSSSDSTITKMKNKVSEEKVTIERKFEQPYDQKCYARVLLASNEQRPLKLGKKDMRRWFVPKYLEHKIDKYETQEFITVLIEWLKSPQHHAIDSIYNYLSIYSLEGFNPFSVEPTETLLSMVEMSVSYLESKVVEFIEETPVFKQKDLLSMFDDSQKDIVSSLILRHCKEDRNLKDPLTGKGIRYYKKLGWTINQAQVYLDAQHPSKIAPF